MRPIKEILRYHANGHGLRQIAQTLGMDRKTVRRVLAKAKERNIGIAEMDRYSDRDLEALLFPPIRSPKEKLTTKLDFDYVVRELKKKGATRKVLYCELMETLPPDQRISYKRFCTRLREHVGETDEALRSDYVAGEVIMVDYAGQTIVWHNRETGKDEKAQIFVGVLGSSDFKFAWATRGRTFEDWIEAHQRMFAYFGGTTKTIICDNLKAAVIKASRVLPEIQPTYRDMCKHYNDTLPVPALPHSPTHKAKGEKAVQTITLKILFPLRKRQFFSLEEINAVIREGLDKLNDAPFSKIDGSPRQLWNDIEKNTLRPLPANRFEFYLRGSCKVPADYHVLVDGHFYSVPHAYRGSTVDTRLTRTSVEVYSCGELIAVHTRAPRGAKKCSTTLPEHRPPNHQAIMNTDVEAQIELARGVGPNVVLFIEQFFGLVDSIQVHHLNYSTLAALKTLNRDFGASRLDDACFIAIHYECIETRFVRDLLNAGRDQSPEMNELRESKISRGPEHGNIRGPEYYENLRNTR